MNFNSKYVVRLSAEEREELERVIRSQKVAALKRWRAELLLQADAGPEGSGPTDAEVAGALGVAPLSVHRVRQAYVERGLAAALERTPSSGRKPRKLDGAQEARLIAVACGPAPEGRARWTMQLLADRLVELHVVDSVSPECVRQTLKKTNSNRG
jgi:transposase